jgi:hypothetical protein
MKDAPTETGKCPHGAGCHCTDAHCQKQPFQSAEERTIVHEADILWAGKMSRRCGECLGSLTHRLSQPLTALRGVIELTLLAERKTEEYCGALQQALDQTDRIVQLVVSLREFAESAIPSSLEERVLFGEVTTGLYVQTDPDRLRLALQRTFDRVIRSSPPASHIQSRVSAVNDRACLSIDAPKFNSGHPEALSEGKTDTPGGVFAQAAKANSLDWIITRRLIEGLGGTSQMTNGDSQGHHLQIFFPIANEHPG